MTKKQTNLILGVIVFIIASFAIFFTDDSSKLITFEEAQPSSGEDVFEKEVIIMPTKAELRESTAEITIKPELVDTEAENPEEREISENTYMVLKVVDGDTLDVNIQGKVERLRLIGIDTPETVDPRKPIQCFGKEASDKAKELLIGKSVGLEIDESQGERDKYGRLLRYVFLPDGTNFNLYMISEGYAHEYTYDEAYKYQVEFKQAEAEARNTQKGLWSPETCIVNN